MARQYVKTVSKKGQVVIPAEIRRRMGIKRKVLFTEEKGRVLIEPLLSMDDAFGTGGREMYAVAKEISKDRRAEAKLEDA